MTIGSLPSARSSETTAAKPPTSDLPVMPATRALQKSLDASPGAAGTGSPAPRRTLEVPATVPSARVPQASTGGSSTAEPPRKPQEVPAPGAESPRSRTGDLPAWSLMLAPGERLNAAVRQMERGDFVSAVATVEQLLVDEPNHLDALLTLGNLYSLTGRVADARESFAQAINREPLCVEARVFGGLAALQAGELAEARAELGKALFLEPTLAIGHYLMAQVQERLMEQEGARRSYRNAIAQLRFPQRQLAGHYPELPDSAEAITRAARYALAALEEAS
jgi:chemotaxis protein methyltransferase CheR